MLATHSAGDNKMEEGGCTRNAGVSGFRSACAFADGSHPEQNRSDDVREQDVDPAAVLMVPAAQAVHGGTCARGPTTNGGNACARGVVETAGPRK